MIQLLDGEEQSPALPPMAAEGMFPSAAPFLCPDWKAARKRPQMEPALAAFRRAALPRLFTRPGVIPGNARTRTRVRMVPCGTWGAYPATLALEETLERVMPVLHPSGSLESSALRREDILVRYRPEPTLTLLVMLDTSLSMSGRHRILAAVIGALLAEQIPTGKLALMAFHSEPKLLIRFGERVRPLDAAYRVLGSPVGGVTNISAALEQGLVALGGLGSRTAHAVLITDGERTAGPDPCHAAHRFRKLHVVLVGRRNVALSKEMARLGKGLWRGVDSLEAVPQILLGLMQHLCNE